MMIKPYIVQLQRKCSFAPSSWTGETICKEPVYIRYRWGTLSIQVGALPHDENEPHFKLEFETQGTDSPSHMSEHDMKRKLNEYVKFKTNNNE